MLERQRHRLLREDPWAGATALAQELYAMFIDELPTQLPGVILDPANGLPPIDIPNPPSSGDIPLIRIGRGDTSVDIALSGGNLTINGDPVGDTTGGGGGTTGSGNMFPGQIVSHLGSNVYEVNGYPNGRTAGATVLNVLQLEGDSNYPHAAGRWAWICSEPDGNYSMIVPTWG